MYRLIKLIFIVAIELVFLGHAQIAFAQTGSYTFVTLGTQGGPVPASLERSEPANLLYRNGEAHLIDVGDGAASRMVLAGAPFQWLKTIFVSHIHFDHIGGLYAVLGLRLQTRTAEPLTIYGPPGIKDIVAGLHAAMEPSAVSGFGMPGEEAIAPEFNVTVVELWDGAVVKLDGLTVRVAENTHYSFEPGSVSDISFKSLSFRFDMPERSIVYTGDTGPSTNLEALAEGADLLVSEMIDLTLALDNIRNRQGQVSAVVKEQIAQHLSTHHLTTEQVGALAQRANVGRVVLTHLVAGQSSLIDAARAEKYVQEVQTRYSGPVVVANDMERF